MNQFATEECVVRQFAHPHISRVVLAAIFSATVHSAQAVLPDDKPSVPAAASRRSSTAETTAETAFWNSIKDSQSPRDFEAYLGQYPKGHFAVLARDRLQAIRTAAPPSAAQLEGNGRPIFVLAFEAYQKGAFEEAVALFQKGLALSPKDAAAHYYICDSMSQIGRAKEALVHCKNAAMLAPDSKEGLLASAKVSALRASQK